MFNQNEIKTEIDSAKKESLVDFVKEILGFALITIAIVLPVRLFIAEPYIVSGSSMEPTFYTNDYLIVDRISLRFTDVKRGEVLILRHPQRKGEYLIKRVIGLPGDTVSMKDNKITISNSSNKDGFDLDQSYIENKATGSFSTVLGNDQYFVLGDNRPRSADSRIWGNFSKADIVGRPLIRLIPVTEIGLYPGDHSKK